MTVGSKRISNDPIAWAAICCAGLAFAVVPGAGAIVALVLARTALTERGLTDRARSAARAAVWLGGVNLALCALLTGWWWLTPPADSSAPSASRPTPTAHAFDPKNIAHRSLGGDGPEHFSEDGAVRSVKIGSIQLVDLGTDIKSLHGELRHQARAAVTAGQSMVVWVSAPNCSPCNGVSAALTNVQMQAALENTRLVRVNRDEFAGELDALGVPVHAIPGFARLDSNNRPIDYLNGGEWDEDLPRNIAPVLAGFLRGNYNTRRQPWRGTARRKITAL